MSTPFMQLYVADYLGDTQHFTTEQHGAYLLILMTMWRAGGDLPADDMKLARIARLSLARWNRVKGEIMEKLNIENGRVTQKRLRAELKKAQEKSEKRADAGRIGGTAKALKDNKPDLANASILPQHSSEPELEPERKKEEGQGASQGEAVPQPAADLFAPLASKPEAGSSVVPLIPLPDTPPVTDVLDRAMGAYNAIAEENRWPQAGRTDARDKKLRRRLTDAGNFARRNGEPLSDIEAWEVSMKRAGDSPFLRGETGRGSGHETWRPSLKFFLQQESFTSLLEGKYDDTEPAGGGTGAGARAEGLARATAAYTRASG